MNNDKITRAWQDEDFRADLSSEEQSVIPQNPAGAIELDDDQLNQVSGGASFLSFCRTVCGVYCKITKEFNCYTNG